MATTHSSLQVVHSALSIKNWVCSTTSPFIWSSVISKALPEMLEVNPTFSAMNINKKTKWGKHEAEIIKYYLQTMYEITIPTEVLYENADIDYKSYDFFSTVNDTFISSIKRFFHLG